MSGALVAHWQELSSLYEQADQLDEPALAAWLAQLRAQPHPLLPQLEAMLEARAEVRRNGFLDSLPTLTAAGVEHAEAGHWSAGDRIGPYRLLRPLGRGGMADVWLAERDDGAFQRRVALKLMAGHAGRAGGSFAQRFARERDILASLHHPHIAGLYDAGVTPEGQPWLALEYAEGETFDRWCDVQRLGVAARVALLRQVLLAVQHAHANLVIHRDLKPANIVVTPQGQVRLLDFGIAKLMEAEGGARADTELTRVNGRPMTPQYAAPEQLRGEPLTTACDVYALGVVLYELLCGSTPYELARESGLQLELAILEFEPRAPSRRGIDERAAAARSTTPAALRKLLSSDLDAIVLHALAKDPLARYPSVDALRADLDRWAAGEPVEARAPSNLYRAGKFVLRHRIAVALGGAGVATLAVVAAVAVVMGLQARADSARASAAKDFMLSLFKRADQEKARGADITARELLETGRRDLLTGLAKQPALQAELLKGIGTIERDMGEYPSAIGTFDDAARIYAQVGPPREAALARAEQANAAMRSSNIPQAKAALEQAQATPGRPRSDAELNARIGEVAGWISVLQGQMLPAKALFLQGYQDTLRAFGAYNPKTMAMLRARLYVEERLHEYDQASALLAELESTAAHTPGMGARERASLAMDRAQFLRATGYQAELYQFLQSASARCASDIGPNYSDCRDMMFREIEAALELGLEKEARQHLPALKSIAEDRSFSPERAANARFLILRIASANGPGEQQTAAFEEVRALASPSTSLPLRAPVRAKAMLSLAEVRLRQHAPAEALGWIRGSQALLRLKDGTLPHSDESALSMTLLGIARLQLGDAEGALTVLESATDERSSIVGPDHPTTCMASLNQVLALEALGRYQEALAVIGRAQTVLSRTLGIDAPEYGRIATMQSRIERKMQAEPNPRIAEGKSARGTDSKDDPATEFFT